MKERGPRHDDQDDVLRGPKTRPRPVVYVDGSDRGGAAFLQVVLYGLRQAFGHPWFTPQRLVMAGRTDGSTRNELLCYERRFQSREPLGSSFINRGETICQSRSQKNLPAQELGASNRRRPGACHRSCVRGATDRSFQISKLSHCSRQSWFDGLSTRCYPSLR